MANLVSSSTGNFTAAGTWSVIDTTSFLNSEAASTASTTSFVSSQSFIPGAITIDGIGLKILSRTSGGGTFSVRLAIAGVAVTGTTVTTNSSSFSLYGNISGWVFFKFSSPITLTAATSYTVQIQSSIASTVTVYRDATTANWSRFLRTTTQQLPSATDYLVITGEQTGTGTFNSVSVTMNETAATTYGTIEISANGSLIYGTSISTAYQLRLSGFLYLNGGGTLTIGSSGTPIPTTSTANLEFVVSSNVQYGLQQRGDSTFTTYGAAKTGRAYLNADAAASATSITTDISTGWKSGDAIAIASTTTTVGQTELVNLSTDASGTLVSISALTNSHSGISPTKAEIINLTRNIKIFGQSLTLQSYVFLNGTSSNSINNTEFYFLGSGTGSKRGIDVASSANGATTFSGCSLRNFEVANSIGFSITGTQNCTITDCVTYRISTIHVLISGATDSTVIISNVWSMVNIVAGNNLFQTTSIGGNFTNCVGVSSTGYGISTQGNDMVAANWSINGFVGHSNNTGGVNISSHVSIQDPVTVQSLNIWRNARGLVFNPSSNIIIDTVNAFSNTIANIAFITAPSANVVLKNVVSNAGNTPACPIGLSIAHMVSNIYVENSTFGATTTHSTGDVDTNASKFYVQVLLRNCILGSTTQISNRTVMAYAGYIASSRHQQTANTHIMYKNLGNISKDNIIYDNINPFSTSSTRLTPLTATSTAKLLSMDKDIIVPSGKSLKVSVSIRQSVIGDGAAYNGNLPRLFVRKNSAVGLTSDTLLATATISSVGSFETITGTTSIATDDGILSFYVDCDGSAGFINIDQWKVEVI